ncbi:MAG: polysaccharide deacetylase family protein [Flavobacteriaceae bacterium]|nr:polysaccharide deacetylase family protein [Flavobacteriaceae bacterium]
MNILTFDVEDWFHILDHKSTKTEKEWVNFPTRMYNNMEKIFEILDQTNTKASFFVLGWIAEKYPDIVREIKDRGYEIGSHTHLHQLAYNQNRKEFYQDVERSIKTLEDITGDKVKMFRAPGFSITKTNKWAFEVLYELGIEIDSSIFPSSRAHGGMPSFKRSEPSLLKYNGVFLKEFPISTSKIFGKTIVFSGGGYFRLLPYFLTKELTKKSDYNMSYFHPRDFDIGQPIISDLSIIRKFKSYVGISGAQAKLQNWLSDFNFTDISEANNIINWDNKIIKI